MYGLVSVHVSSSVTCANTLTWVWIFCFLLAIPHVGTLINHSATQKCSLIKLLALSWLKAFESGEKIV